MPAWPSPAANSTLAPTVIVRLLVDSAGRVVESRAFQPRADLAAFEHAATQAVREFRFSPAMRHGEMKKFKQALLPASNKS